MAPKSEPAAQSSTTSSLQRGKACLRCRKRKMRCDGVKPACQQCVRAKKGDCCEYDDGKGKTRTQLLREHIERLESRVRELEDPEQVQPSITLFDPHNYHSDSSSDSNSVSPSASGGIPVSPPFSFDRGVTPFMTPLAAHFTTSPSPTIPDVFSTPVEEFQPPAALAQLLLDIFLPHRHQLGLEICVDRLRDSLALPVSEQPHPVLLNAIFLWSCFLSRPEPLSTHEPHYLARTLDALNDALQYPARAVDAVRGGALLAQYFYVTGRLVEAHYHLGAVASLALRFDLHRSAASAAAATDEWDLLAGLVRLEPAMDPIEEGERIGAFWQVYALDRVWSAALGRVPAIPADIGSMVYMDVPWPQSMEEYQSVDDAAGMDVVKTFLAGQSTGMPGGFSTPALRAKACALFGGASQLARTPQLKTGSARPELAALDGAIARFVTTLLPVAQLDAAVPEVKHALLATHSLAHAAAIRLTEPFAHESAVAHQKALRAAREVVSVIKHIMDPDYDFLDPAIGVAWMAAANVLFREVALIESAWPLANAGEARAELGLLYYAMSSLSTRFPVLATYATQIQTGLSTI